MPSQEEKNSNNSATEEDDASAEIQRMLGTAELRRPKHIGEGLTSGVGCIIRGAVGACGTAVLMPAVGAAHGSQEIGISGAVLGGVGGAIGGVAHAANRLGGGIVAGVGQIIQGAAATPAAVMKPLRNNGKWWNANESKWVRTNLLDEERWIATQAMYDEDILGEEVIPEDMKPPSDDDDDDDGENIDVAGALKKKKVKDMYYYDLLGLDPSVDAGMVKRRYYILARKYAPDRCGANPKAQQEFNEIGHAYMILTNEELRAKYDRVGRKDLWKAEDDHDNDQSSHVDPNVLYTFLFGSEKFDDYIGRLAAATAARVGEEQNSKLTLEEARLLQRRRVTRLALKLSERLQSWAEDEMENSAKANWTAEAEVLSNASYGVELVQVIGKVYSLAAIQFLGSIESGIGMPSIRNWAKNQKETMKHNTKRISQQIQNTTIFTGENVDTKHLQKQVNTAIQKSKGDAHLETLAKDILKKSNLQTTAIEIMWTQTVLDITNTLHEAVQYVLHDQNVTAETRKKRAKGLIVLGEIFQKAVSPAKLPEQEELEEIAFHAMLDTVWRQEMGKRYQVQSGTMD